MHCIAPTNDPAGPASPAANRRSCLCYYRIPVHRSPLLIFCHLSPHTRSEATPRSSPTCAGNRLNQLQARPGQPSPAQVILQDIPSSHSLISAQREREREYLLSSPVQYSTGRFASCRIISHRIKSHYINFTVRFFPDRPPIPTRPPFYYVAPSPGVSRLLIHRLAPAILSLWPGFVPFPSFPTRSSSSQSLVCHTTHPLVLYTPIGLELELTLLLAFIYLCIPSFNPPFPPVLACSSFLLVSPVSSRASIFELDPGLVCT